LFLLVAHIFVSEAAPLLEEWHRCSVQLAPWSWHHPRHSQSRQFLVWALSLLDPLFFVTGMSSLESSLVLAIHAVWLALLSLKSGCMVCVFPNNATIASCPPLRATWSECFEWLLTSAPCSNSNNTTFSCCP
jgi:hypothetical protein